MRKVVLSLLVFVFINVLMASPAISTPMAPPVLGDFVWNDLNRNGIQDPGEFGINDVLVELHGNDSATNLIDSMLTVNNGEYEFDAANSGYDLFWLRFILPPGYEFTPQSQGGDPSIDSDADPITGIAGYSSGIPIGSLPETMWDAGLTAVPIPAAIYLLGAGFLGLAGIRRKFKK
jgi:SdrD B-like protein